MNLLTENRVLMTNFYLVMLRIMTSSENLDMAVVAGIRLD
jgi:hypothetical protein